MSTAVVPATSIRNRILGNRLLARQQRARLLAGYAADSIFALIVASLTDDEIVEQYLEHENIQKGTRMGHR